MHLDRESVRSRVISLVREGHTYSEVADLVDISKGRVAGIMFRHKNPGYEKQRRPQYGTGAVFRAMARAESEA